jgi:hypothetical protein
LNSWGVIQSNFNSNNPSPTLAKPQTESSAFNFSSQPQNLTSAFNGGDNNFSFIKPNSNSNNINLKNGQNNTINQNNVNAFSFGSFGSSSFGSNSINTNSFGNPPKSS